MERSDTQQAAVPHPRCFHILSLERAAVKTRHCWASEHESSPLQAWWQQDQPWKLWKGTAGICWRRVLSLTLGPALKDLTPSKQGQPGVIDPTNTISGEAQVPPAPLLTSLGWIQCLNLYIDVEVTLVIYAGQCNPSQTVSFTAQCSLTACLSKARL